MLKWVFSLLMAKKVNIMNHKLFVANNSMRTQSQYYKYHRTKSNLQSINKYTKQNVSFD